MPVEVAAIEQTLSAARQRLLAERVKGGHWEGELSSSALSTATAVGALALHPAAKLGDRLGDLVQSGITWLGEHQNPDGGWGDTVDSPSNISTTTLCWAALGASERVVGMHSPQAARTAAWLKERIGELTPSRMAHAIREAYGQDRTFSAPILTMGVLSGRWGPGREVWELIPALPFELAACPHDWFRWLGLPVVSYALPALIAVGQVRHHQCPPRNPLVRLLRDRMRGRTLRVLESIQPESGGFLEATPLTSFVVMSLVASGLSDHPVARRGLDFLETSVRADGSWPIDTNLAMWVTTLSVNALTEGACLRGGLSEHDCDALQIWLLDQQYQKEHPYTHAPPGGWAWTDLSGGVPDADDTAGALLALWHLNVGIGSADDERAAITTPHSRGGSVAKNVVQAAAAGVRWLLDLQNKDGGIPTFCRGWGKLPFDRSSPDLTAHALRAWNVWKPYLPNALRTRVHRATEAAIRYLLQVQRKDGSWIPLWFGNQQAPGQENPLYGTTRVLRAGSAVCAGERLRSDWTRALRRGTEWVLSVQNTDGGWGGAASVPSSIEETALAVEALAEPTGVLCHTPGTVASLLSPFPRGDTGGYPSFFSSTKEGGTGGASHTRTEYALERGCAWLVEHTEHGTRFDASPIGLYFAKLWYSEQLYPLVFSVAALERVRRTHTCRSHRS